MPETSKRAANSPLQKEAIPFWVADIKDHTSKEIASLRADMVEMKAAILQNTETLQKHEAAISSISLINSNQQNLQREIERLYQMQLSNNLIITNIPATNGETNEHLRTLLENICAILKVKLSFENDVIEVIRLRSQKVSTNSGPILVKFANQKLKLSIMQSEKNNSIRQGQIINSSSTEKIYFSHQLTHHFQDLQKTVRLADKKTLKFKYVWFSWRHIALFVKKDENGKAIRISTKEDIQYLEAKTTGI